MLKGEYKRDQQPRHQGSAPHHRYGIGGHRSGDDAAALKIGHHPSGNALLCGVLAEDQRSKHPEPAGAQKAPIGDRLFGLALSLQRRSQVHHPQQTTHACQQRQRQTQADLCRRCDQKRAQQCAHCIAAMHQVHAPGTVSRVITDQDGANIDDAALCQPHQEEGQRPSAAADQSHQTIAHCVTCRQQQRTGFHAQLARQHRHQKTCQQVADAHQGQQRTGHAIGKTVLLLQQTDHHTAGDGAYAAEEKGDKSRIAQAGALCFVHDVPHFSSHSGVPGCQDTLPPLNHTFC